MIIEHRKNGFMECFFISEYGIVGNPRMLLASVFSPSNHDGDSMGTAYLPLLKIEDSKVFYRCFQVTKDFYYACKNQDKFLL